MHKQRHIYFLGIGGIGMSALARYFHQQGVQISGYDKTPTPLTQALEEEGMQIYYTESTDHIGPHLEMVIYTPAIPKNSIELTEVHRQQLKLFKRAEVLGQLTREHTTIAIAGTHGKTSVTSMVAHILQQAGVRVTAFIGGISKNLNSNFIINKNSEVMVVEADEFDRSFLTLHPDIAVITSMDADHLDIYDNHSCLENTFQEFVGQIKPNGLLIHKKGLNLKTSKQLSYSATEQAHTHLERRVLTDNCFHIDMRIGSRSIKDILYHFPGIYNTENAMAAATACLKFGLSPLQISNGLSSYKGVKRRFDIRYQSDTRIYIDDYAHHPEEIKACIGGVREMFPGRQLYGVFQPHLYSRTRDFEAAFACALEQLDKLWLLDIYPAREKPIPGVSAENLLEKINLKDKTYIQKTELISDLQKRDPGLVISLGAGDIDQLVIPLEKMMKELDTI